MHANAADLRGYAQSEGNFRKKNICPAKYLIKLCAPRIRTSLLENSPHAYQFNSVKSVFFFIFSRSLIRNLCGAINFNLPKTETHCGIQSKNNKKSSESTCWIYHKIIQKGASLS